jgi:flagellar secretion chaperone FliS
MNQQDIASLYRQVSASGSNPVGLVVKLYDAILEDFRRAREAIAAGEVERRVSSLNHALLVIAELEGVLDFDRGGVVARQLQGFYGVTRGLIVEANLHASPERIERLLTLYKPLRQAWQQVESDVANHKVNVPAREPRAVQTAIEPERPVIAVGADSDATSSGWSA